MVTDERIEQHAFARYHIRGTVIREDLLKQIQASSDPLHFALSRGQQQRIALACVDAVAELAEAELMVCARNSLLNFESDGKFEDEANRLAAEELPGKAMDLWRRVTANVEIDEDLKHPFYGKPADYRGHQESSPLDLVYGVGYRKIAALAVKKWARDKIVPIARRVILQWFQGKIPEPVFSYDVMNVLAPEEEALEAQERADTDAIEEAEVDPTDESERADVPSEALTDRPGETPEGPRAGEPEDEQPQGIDEGLVESLQPRIRPDSTTANSREGRLQAFSSANSGTTLADIRYSAQVHKPDFYDWKSGKLPDTSVMSLRIDDVLAGRRRLQKKPRQWRRPD